MNEQIAAKLHDEIRLARSAQSAWESYVEMFVERVKGRLYEAFLNTHTNDVDQLLAIKQLASAVCALETDIKSDIETGRLAMVKLEEMNNARPN